MEIEKSCPKKGFADTFELGKLKIAINNRTECVPKRYSRAGCECQARIHQDVKINDKLRSRSKIARFLALQTQPAQMAVIKSGACVTRGYFERLFDRFRCVFLTFISSFRRPNKVTSLCDDPHRKNTAACMGSATECLHSLDSIHIFG